MNVIGREDCGCEVQQDNDARVEIVYCSIHQDAFYLQGLWHSTSIFMEGLGNIANKMEEDVGRIQSEMESRG